MAFNLDKNDEPKKSKFDLSKADESTPEFQEPKKSNNTLIIIVVLAVLGVGGYFIMNNSSKDSTATASSTTSDTASASSSAATASADTANTATGEATGSGDASLTVSSPTTFPKGSAEVSSVDDAKLNQILDYLKSNPSAIVTIEGYASSEGDAAFNDQLSQARAANFVKFLVSKGVKAENINAVGKGIENPVASNDDEAGRSQNRRVEVKF